MDSFWTYFKRHSLKLWLANLLGSLTVTTIIFTVYIIMAVIGLAAGFGILAYSFTSLPSVDFLLDQTAYLSTGLIIGTVIFSFLIFLITIFLISFQSAGQYATTNEVFKSNRVRIRTFFVKGFRFSGKLVLQMLLIFLLQLPTFLLWVAAIALFALTGEIGIYLGILLIIFSIFLFFAIGLSMIYAPVVMIAEHMGPWQSIVQSFRIFRRNIGKVILVALLNLATGMIYGAIATLLYLPMIFTIIDPTGILASITMFILSIVQWAYNIAAIPLMLTIVGLIIVYHYFKYFRPQLFPQDPDQANPSEPTFAFKSDS